MEMSLFADPVFQRFAAQRPMATAGQLVLRRLLDPETVDRLFREHAEAQYEQTLLFSTLSRLMTSVVLGEHRSVNAACRKLFEQLDVSVTSVYNKLQRVEPQTSRALVRHAYRECVAVCPRLGGAADPDVRGYATRILDGNHLSGTEHRLKETRSQSAAPLPGKSLVVFDPRHDAVRDVFPIEDGHAQELSALDDVIATLQKNELWIADRNFCAFRFLWKIAAAGSCFVIRQHGKVKGVERGRLRKIGRSDTAEVFENQLDLAVASGETLRVRRIEVRLLKPTRDGDTTLVLLTNLPAESADGVRVSNLYRDRWKIETAFLHLTVSLNCEMKTLCYPAAALFCFALALVAYNALAILKSLTAAACGRESVSQLSHYYVAGELAETTAGLLIALPDDRWREVSSLPLETFAARLLEVGAHINLQRYRKSVRGPKHPPPRRTKNKRHVHLSTKRILDQRRNN